MRPSVDAAPPTSGNALPELRQIGAPDPEEGRKALEQMRRLGIVGDYFFEFQLRLMPRRGEERLLAGRLWGSRNEDGPITRVVLGEGAEERRLLIQNGVHSGVWQWRAGAPRIEALGVDALFQPLVPGADLTAFDLQMPFIYWPAFDYLGLTRFRGRPAHVIVLRPPAPFRAQYPALTGVRVHLDTQFNAIVQTEQLGEGGAVLKTFSLVDLKKLGEQWIPKTFDLRDEVTRNKTRLGITGAALELELAAALFEPAQLAEHIQNPTTKIVRLNP